MVFTFSIEDAFRANPFRASFTIRGEPRSQQRNRPGRNGNQYNPSRRDQIEFMNVVRNLFQAKGRPIPRAENGVPVFMEIVCCFPSPRRAVPNITNRADVDNLAKFVLDALNGPFYADDCQVVQLCVKKEFDDRNGGRGYTRVRVWREIPQGHVIHIDHDEDEASADEVAADE
jgi:Holliday junction resolvase RusA-like endonuclease